MILIPDPGFPVHYCVLGAQLAAAPGLLPGLRLHVHQDMARPQDRHPHQDQGGGQDQGRTDR